MGNKDFQLPPLLQRIGNTPLVRVSRAVSREVSAGVEVFVKAEWFNPGGSVKDRPALSIVSQGIRSGAFVPGQTLIDSTSGNTGIAYAMIGAVLGFPVTLVMPDNVSAERKKIVTAYGAQIIYSDPLEGSDGARILAGEILREGGAKYFYADQYNNPANPQAHYETTGPEILRDTGGRVTHLVAGLGTSGTAMGTSRFLKEKQPGIRTVALQPEPFHGIEGWKNTDTTNPVGIYNAAYHDEKLTIPTEPAYWWAKELASKEGLLVSPSAGAAFYGAMEVAKKLQEGVIVVILADGGDKYLSTTLYS